MKRTAAVVVALIVLLAAAGGGYFYARQRAAQEMEAGLAAFRASLPPGSTFSYASAEPSLLSRSAHLTGVALSAHGVAYTAATADVAPGPGSSFRHLALTRLTSHSAGGEAAADSLAVDNLGLPVLAADVAEVDPAAVTFDHGEVHGLTTLAGDKTKLAAKQVTIDHYGAGQASAADMNGLDLQTAATPAVHAQVDHLYARRAPLAELVAHYRTSGSAAPLPNLSYDAGLAQLALSVGGKPLVTLASLDLGSDPAANDVLNSHTMMHGLVVQADDQATPMLGRLGYPQLQADLQMQAAVDRNARQVRIDKFDIDAAGMGRLHLAMGLDNMPEAAMGAGASLEKAILVFQQARLQGLSVSYEDHGLVPKYLAMLAAQQGVTPEALKQLGQRQLAAAAAQANLPPAVTDPVHAFMEDPKRLAITVAPPQPLPLADLAGRAGADPQRALGLVVTN